MQKTIGDVARYLKQLLPENIPEGYPIKSMFSSISSDDSIRKGVVSFRDFIIKLCDGMTENKSLCDMPIKGNKKFSDEVTLTVEFPFINNLKSILINIGQYGVLSGKGDSLLVMSWDNLSLKRSLNKNSTTKISTPQMLKSLKFLSECGICFKGIDLSAKKLDVSKIEAIEVTYPDVSMLIGWKTFGLAQSELSTRKNDDILLRCDYRILNSEDVEIVSILKEFVNPLSDQRQKFILNLHQFYLDSKMECNVELGFLCTHFIYSYKKKALWRFSVSFHNGYRMVLKTKNTTKYFDVISKFPVNLREKITKGYGCDRKTGTGHGNCQKGCEGFSFPIDDSILDISKELMIWNQSELSSM